MQDTTHLEGSPDPGGSPDKGGSPQSTVFLTVQSVSEVPSESVFSRGTQPAEWRVSSAEHEPWHGQNGKHFLEAWVRYCQCLHWQDGSVRFLPVPSANTQRQGRPWAQDGNFLLALVLATPSHYTTIFQKWGEKGKTAISNESDEQISRLNNQTGCLIFTPYYTQFWLLT